MSVKKLIDALQDVGSIFAAGGAKTQSRNFGSFINAISRHENEAASTYLQGLRSVLAKTTKKPGAQAQADVVAFYTEKLNAAGTDEHAFRSILARLNKDKTVRKPEMEAIAAAYRGGQSQWRTKKDAAQAIMTFFNERAYEAVKMLRVDKGSRF